MNKVSPQQTRMAIIFALVCGVMGLGMACFGSFNAAGAAAILAWPSTEGEVISTDIDITYSSSEYNNEPSYRPVVEYRYWVEDQIYFSDQLSMTLDDHYGTREKAGAVLIEYELQDPLRVYYDPGDPTQSVLRTGLNVVTFIPCILGLLFLGFALLLTIGAIRQRAVS